MRTDFFGGFICFLIILMVPMISVAEEKQHRLSLIVKSSGESLHQTVLDIDSDSLMTILKNAKPVEHIESIPFSNRYLLFEDEHSIHLYVMDENQHIYDINTQSKLDLQHVEALKKLSRYYEGMEKKHFGELVEWELADQWIPRYISFKVTDLETGLEFHAQRRAGSQHADVQPLTKTDTEIMKTIYDGKWSWKRRAILVEHNGRMIAASMHGMPHGGGALANGFPGHFCIHYEGSVTHRTKSLDLSHQVMVYKAAGLLEPFVHGQPPENVVQLLMTAVNHNDIDLSSLVYDGEKHITKDMLEQIEVIRVVKQFEPTINSELLVEVPFTFLIQYQGKSEHEQTFTFRLKRESPTSEWTIIHSPI
ncbi:hypothetical protein [Bacillus sp. FJAT-45037]|uniref:hypothetical protein n=1 Tax=Bacillus sp. FJAT-45037 TaxID=2011007 RepID=UPI000C2349BA|nr:hypothetical protein [Bacillus sp. FJAT-45037]